MKKISVLALLLTCVFLMVPFIAKAENFDVTPPGWDFGDVEVGSSTTATLTLTSLGPTPLMVYSVSIQDDATASYTVEPVDVVVLPHDATLDLHVTFSPSFIGDHIATLVVDSDAASSQNHFLLTGTGIPVYTGPGEVIAYVIAFFDASIADGSLTGSGFGNSSTVRHMALRNMLTFAESMIENGDNEGACDQLKSAYWRTDGEVLQPDFVQGPAITELADAILDVIDVLECL